VDMAARSAGGRSASGRYKKHDTARLVFIKSVAMPALRLGKRIPAADWHRLFLPGDDEVSGADKAFCALCIIGPMARELALDGNVSKLLRLWWVALPFFCVSSTLKLSAGAHRILTRRHDAVRVAMALRVCECQPSR